MGGKRILPGETLFFAAEQNLDVSKNQRGNTLCFILNDRFAHIILERAFAHLLVAESGYETDTVQLKLSVLL
jgi:hypothetical protein